MNVYEQYRERLDSLLTKRDALNDAVKNLQVEKEAANLRAQEANQEALRLAQEIQKVRGGQSWLDLKKEIGMLSNALTGKK